MPTQKHASFRPWSRYLFGCLLLASLVAFINSIWVGFVTLDKLDASYHRHRNNAADNVNQLSGGFPSRNEDDGYDIVVTVHHDDMDTFINWGLESYVKHLVDLDDDARIFAIGTQQANSKITSIKRDMVNNSSDAASAWNRIYPIEETIYPFNIDGVGDNRNVNKPTWIFQQMLKLYARRALKSAGISIRRFFLVMDSDTVLTKQIYMQEPIISEDNKGNNQRRSFVCISSESAGAFVNDCDIAPPLVKEVLGEDFQKAYPTNKGEKFTAICHHMLFDGNVIDELLDYVEERSGKKPWVALGSTKISHLSEYELYLGWVMRYHRHTIAARQIHYVNWGRADATTLGIAASYGAKYLTNHDDWTERNICCVNSLWPRDSLKVLAGLKPSTPKCKCCPAKKDCVVPRINCEMLGVKGCRDVNSTEAGSYMIFDKL